VPQEAANGRIHLKPAQKRVLEALANGDSGELTRGQYQEIAGVSRSQAAYDLAELVEAGVLERIGGGRATRYRPIRKSQTGKRRWTSEHIRAELAEFCAGRKEWPSAGAFKAAGRADLYVAASRYGGIGFWAVELGYPRPGRAASTSAPEPPLVRKLAWAGGGALAAALVAAAAAAVVVLSLPHGSTRTAGPARASQPAAAGDRIADESSHPLRTSRAAATRTAKPTAKHVQRSHAQKVRRTHTPPVEPAATSDTATLIAVRTYTPQSGSATSATGHQSTPTPTASAGPGPLRAPLTASAPNPLKAPQGR
jgi:DNA-binding transcriptional ArsR family regulator